LGRERREDVVSEKIESRNQILTAPCGQGKEHFSFTNLASRGSIGRIFERQEDRRRVGRGSEGKSWRVVRGRSVSSFVRRFWRLLARVRMESRSSRKVHY